MAQQLEKVTFVLEELRFDTPGQQLLDRFLIGYPRDGEFHRPQCKVHLFVAQEGSDQEIHRRVADYGLVEDVTVENAISGADGIVLVPRQVSAGKLLEPIILNAKPTSAIFVHGALSDSLEEARTLVAHAMARSVRLASGTAASVTWRLPELDLPVGGMLVTDVLIVVQGEFPRAELHAINGLLPILERGAGGERGLSNVRLLEDGAIWKLLAEQDSMRQLLAAALSRSDSPQGLTIRDGRTQNLMAPGLIEQLATNPRAWFLKDSDGRRTLLMVLDGVVADYNIALRTADSQILSAQLYRPPAPQRHEFSRLAEVVEEYLRSRRAPWPPMRSLLTSQLMETFMKLRERR